MALRHRALVERKQAHHKTRRAKTALRAVARDHGLLHRVQRAIGFGQIGGRPQRKAIDGVCRFDAAVDSAINQTPIHCLGHHHGAGPAVACGTALFGGREAQVLAQQVEQGAVWWYIARIHHLTAMPEPQGAGRQRRRFKRGDKRF